MSLFRTFITTCFLLLLTCLNAQNQVTDTTATVVSYWQKGNRTKLSLTQTKEKYKDGKSTSKSSSTSNIDIFIADATDKSYTIHWKYSNIQLNDPQQNPLAIKLAKLTEGLIIKYKTNEMGAFEVLLNWKEIQIFIYSAIDKIGKEANLAEVTTALTHVKNIYATKESIEQLVIKDVQLYHSLYGGEYKLGEKLTACSYVPNFLEAGGDPIPSIISVQMTELKPADNYCKIKFLQTIDSVKASEVINKWIEKVSAGKSNDSKKPVININDFNEFEVELLTGWLSRAFYRRVVVSDTSKTIETTELVKL